MPLAIIEITGVTAETSYPLTEYLFYASMPQGQQIRPGDDGATIEAIRLDELPGLVERYRAIDPAEVWIRREGDEFVVNPRGSAMRSCRTR